MTTLITSGDRPVEATQPDEWVDVLEVPGTTVINWIQLLNEGDWPGFWRLVQGDQETAAARLPSGNGEPGDRRAGVNIPCAGFSGGKLQVKKPLLSGDLTGLWAFGMR